MYVCDNHISWHYYALDIAQRCSSIFILQQFSKDFCQSRSGQRISMSTPKDSRCQNEDLPHSVVFKKRISEEGYLLLPSNLMILNETNNYLDYLIQSLIKINILCCSSHLILELISMCATHSQWNVQIWQFVFIQVLMFLLSGQTKKDSPTYLEWKKIKR